ncbi:hypothetical protein ACQ4PT_017962 [Festuca glaucescens]
MNDSWKRRYPHPVAGNYHSVPSRRPNGHDDIVFVPSSPPTLRAETRRFSLDFLPGGIGPWEIVDSRCSLVLLAKRKKSGWMRCCFPDLLVCELVTRRYQLIPRMEEMKRHRCVCVFLGECQSGIVSKPGRFTEWAIVDSMSQFSVVYEELIGVADGIGTIRSCSFFSGRKWYVEKKKKKSSPTYEDTHVVHLHGPESLRFLGRGPYCPFWSIEGDSKRLLTPSLRKFITYSDDSEESDMSDSDESKCSGPGLSGDESFDKCCIFGNEVELTYHQRSQLCSIVEELPMPEMKHYVCTLMKSTVIPGEGKMDNAWFHYKVASDEFTVF